MAGPRWQGRDGRAETAAPRHVFGFEANDGNQKTVISSLNEAINKIQVCINNDRIKGIRIWGGHFNAQGDFVPDHNAGRKEKKRTNCRANGWATEVSCPAGQVAVGLRPADMANNGFSGIGRICAPYKITRAGLTADAPTGSVTPQAPTP
jgi:hypothetical protein